MNRKLIVRHVDKMPDVPLNHEPWMSFGACADIDPQYNVFFPDDQDSRKNKAQERKAKSICSTCPVAWECFDFSIRNREIHGIWGGMTFPERCDHTMKYRGHTSSVSQAAHRRHITELNHRKQANHGRSR